MNSDEKRCLLTFVLDLCSSKQKVDPHWGDFLYKSSYGDLMAKANIRGVGDDEEMLALARRIFGLCDETMYTVYVEMYVK